MIVAGTPSTLSHSESKCVISYQALDLKGKNIEIYTRASSILYSGNFAHKKNEPKKKQKKKQTNMIFNLTVVHLQMSYSLVTVNFHSRNHYNG